MTLLGDLRKSAPFRKGSAYIQRLPRSIARLSASPQDYAARPPIIVNSLPKSGTHLLMQVARALPQTRYYGSFIAQTPSLTLRLRSQEEIDRRIAAIVPGEVLGAHLHWSPQTTAALERINALHLFIHRDPRDVLLSEAHYLAAMNRWHAMHSAFAAIKDPQARIRLAIEGDGTPRYPDAAQRIGVYCGWIDDPHVISMRYEDMRDPVRRIADLERIAAAHSARSGVAQDIAPLEAAIDPGRSHTFRAGATQRWKTEMDAENLARVHAAFPELGEA